MSLLIIPPPNYILKANKHVFGELELKKVPLICNHTQQQCLLLFPLISLRLTYVTVCYAIFSLGGQKDFFFSYLWLKAEKRPDKIFAWTLLLFALKVLSWPAALTFKYTIIFSVYSQYPHEAVLSWETELQEQHPSQDTEQQNSCSKCPRLSATALCFCFSFPRFLAKKTCGVVSTRERRQSASSFPLMLFIILLSLAFFFRMICFQFRHTESWPELVRA